MKEVFVKILTITATAAAIVLGMILCVVGGVMEGWWGAFFILCSILIYTTILWLYNRKFK